MLKEKQKSNCLFAQMRAEQRNKIEGNRGGEREIGKKQQKGSDQAHILL